MNLRKVDMATELQILAYHAQRAQIPGLSQETLPPEPPPRTAPLPGTAPSA